MDHMTTTPMKLTTIFDFNKMANYHNDFNNTRVHPQNHTIRFVGLDGESAELSVAQLATIAAIVNAIGAPGPSVDRLFAHYKDHLRSSGFNQATIDAKITSICGRY